MCFINLIGEEFSDEPYFLVSEKGFYSKNIFSDKNVLLRNSYPKKKKRGRLFCKTRRVLQECRPD
ncbi:hypothetical protein CH380_09715 [Leptospira adleri]|uniref:Uncharacterized protein n=1 Tax=Leptospira adleri TaxID=2023186 RepID=A0A2M9YPI9_9LEPT|nr:hypothetical protein CH380_09715 [Leptospira adleri]PJZ63041.1 hypothetical protein CH376_05075 [Leptospira adleri]